VTGSLDVRHPRMGAASLRRFLRRKSYLIKKKAAAEPWWFSELVP
jgi:hypothetical protein